MIVLISVAFISRSLRHGVVHGNIISLRSTIEEFCCLCFGILSYQPHGRVLLSQFSTVSDSTATTSGTPTNRQRCDAAGASPMKKAEV